MPFDGGFLHKTVDELKHAIDCHIDKIYQPSKDELVFLLRKKGFVKRLLVTVKPGSSRIQFTENKFENPAIPPNFCMLLRKHLSSARLIDIIQNGLERVAELCFSATNELGDTVSLRLVCELIANQSNIILVKEDGKIIDALRRSDVETAKRYILPGALYEYPASLQRSNLLNCDINKICDEIFSGDSLISKKMLNRFDGLSPLVCREIEYKLNTLGNNASVLKETVKEIALSLKNDDFYIVKSQDGKLLDFSYIKINQYGGSYVNQKFETASSLLDAFYSEKDTANRINSAAHDIKRLVSNLYSRTEKKLGLRLSELKKCENRDTLRIYGELLKANLHTINNGDEFALVPNYYDENLSTVKIPLNPALSPAKNAEKYFKDYKKTYSAEQTLKLLTENDKNELLYFDSVLDNISRAQSLNEIAEIREELAVAGYIKKSSPLKKSKKDENGFKEFTSSEGYRILVGKNNIQNDFLTTKLSSKNDLWFHTKNIPGSHVVVLSRGQQVSDETILKAATLAAKNSKAANSAQVPVDYTLIKNVKKPAGAKPGMVIYTTNKTVYVDPNIQL